MKRVLKPAGKMIISMDKYWGDDGTVPRWKLAKVIGTNLH